LITALFLSNACIDNNKKNNNKPTITVSIVPQKFFVNKIAGNFLNVNVMIPPGQSPATYEPTPVQIRQLSQSQVYFRIGYIAFEKAWMDKLASINPKMKIVNTAKGTNLIISDTENHANKHKSYNPHIWLLPKSVKKQATIIFNTLSEIYPEHKTEMQNNLNIFLHQCDSLQSELDKTLKPLSETSFIVYHPVWSYLAKEYNLHQIAIEHNGKEATADKLKQIIDFAKQNNIKLIFVQKEFNGTQAETIAKEINGKVLILNPLDYDWFNTMNEFTNAF
jgi:zinc transport system substrate-binding protein